MGCPFRKRGSGVRRESLTFAAEMKNSQDTLELKTVCDCNRCLGTATLHPQATLVNLAKPGVGHEAVKFEFYAILLIEACADGCSCCGRRYYDYADSTMVFLKPGEVFSMSRGDTLPDKGWLLAFHPDLLLDTSLSSDIRNYSFFDYRKEEALHLSSRETETVFCCLENIEDELRHPIDTHSGTILSHQIELLLDYCSRFYERQFITRENCNDALVAKTEKLTERYILDEYSGGEPDMSRISEQLKLSPAYFNDMLKFSTGKSFTEYFQLRRIGLAKRMLAEGKANFAEVARVLAFPSTQYFCAVFKRLTGCAPGDYRRSLN